MSDCTHQCDTCAANCDKRGAAPQKIQMNELSSAKRVLAVMSGKGGVGKSMVTSLLAVLARREGLRVGILDADMTGPSIPRAFGLKDPIEEGPDGFFPALTKTGIEVMSVNLMLQSEETPLLWRGSLLSDLATRFYSQTVWDDLDLLLIDCPPGTGDIPLTVLEKFPLDGVVMVTSPQELVGMVVEKAIRMAKTLGVPIAALVENYAYYLCPHCGARHPLFSGADVSSLAARHGIFKTASLPLSQKLAGAADRGMIELFENDALDDLVRSLLAEVES